MWIRASSLLLATSIINDSLASPAVRGRDSSPTVQLDNGTFVGISEGNVNKFLGITFAKPPYVPLPCFLYGSVNLHTSLM